MALALSGSSTGNASLPHWKDSGPRPGPSWSRFMPHRRLSRCYNCVHLGFEVKRLRALMNTVGARDLKQHTGEVIARVRSGERLLLTVRGRPVAVIAPIDQQALEAAISREAQKVEDGGWLAAAEDAFTFWDNDDDAIWDRVAVK